MKVLVTGANGFLGSRLCRALASLGAEVHVLCRSSSDLSSLDGVRFVKHLGDVTDGESLSRALRHTAGAECVFHLAAVIGYKPAQRELMRQVNVEGTRNVVEACKLFSCKLVHVSSLAAVGCNLRADEPLLHEDSAFNMAQLHLGYFDSKRAAEDLVLRAARGGEVHAVSVCPTSVMGAGDGAKSSRKSYNQLIKGWLPFYTSGGVNVVHVDDVVDGIVKGWQRGKSGHRYILGSDDNMTVKQLFHSMAEVAHVSPPWLPLPTACMLLLARLGLAPYEKVVPAQMFSYYDCGKAKRELGYSPRPAASAIRESVEWSKAFLRQRGDTFRPSYVPDPAAAAVSLLVCVVAVVCLLALQ